MQANRSDRFVEYVDGCDRLRTMEGETVTDETVCFVREVVATYVGEHKQMPAMCSSRDADVMLRKVLPDGSQERVVAIAMNNKNRPVGWTLLGIGTGSQCAVDLTALLRFVLLTGAPAFLLGHNHPSGDPGPSADDIELTKRISQGAQAVGLKMLDHVIIGNGRFSFLDAGLL